MAKKKKAAPLSGAAKLKASGRKAIMLAVTPEQHAILKRAAALEMRPVSQYIAYIAIKAAEARIAKADAS